MEILIRNKKIGLRVEGYKSSDSGFTNVFISFGAFRNQRMGISFNGNFKKGFGRFCKELSKTKDKRELNKDRKTAKVFSHFFPDVQHCYGGLCISPHPKLQNVLISRKGHSKSEINLMAKTGIAGCFLIEALPQEKKKDSVSYGVSLDRESFFQFRKTILFAYEKFNRKFSG